MHCLSCDVRTQCKKIFLLNWVLYHVMVWLTRKCNGLTRSDRRVGKEMRPTPPFIDHPPPFSFEVGTLSLTHCIGVSWHHLKCYHTLYHHHCLIFLISHIFVVWKQARKLQATLVWNYDPATDLLTGVKCRATSVAKNHIIVFSRKQINLVGGRPILQPL